MNNFFDFKVSPICVSCRVLAKKVAPAKRRGKYCGGVPILKYHDDRDNKKLLVNPDEARTVRYAILQALGRAFSWADTLESGQIKCVSEPALTLDVDGSYVACILNLTHFGLRPEKTEIQGPTRKRKAGGWGESMVRRGALER